MLKKTKEGELSSSKAKESLVTQIKNNPLRDVTDPAGRIQWERMRKKDRLPKLELLPGNRPKNHMAGRKKLETGPD